MSDSRGGQESGLFGLVEPLERILKGWEPAGAAGPAPAGAGAPGPTAPPPLAAAGGADPFRPPVSERDRARLAALYELSARVSGAPADFDGVLAAVLDVVVRFARAERGLLLLVGPEGRIDIEVARNDREERLDPLELAFSRSIAQKAIDERQTVYVPDAAAAASLGESVADLSLRSALCVPLRVAAGARAAPSAAASPAAERRRLRAHGEPEALGAIYIDGVRAKIEVAAGDLEFFDALAHQAAAAILNARLYQLATTDPLSRLYTRWHFQRLLADAMRRAELRRHPASLLLADIDDFKRLNDAFGHVAGDEVIRELGETLRTSTRAIDACFRYGGEEFAVLLADTDKEGARIAAEKLRRAIAGRRFGRGAYRATVSIGYATAPTDALDPQELVKRADQALYHAKALGKNRSAGWTPELGAAAKRGDKLAGIVTGDFAADYNNVQLLIETIAAINATTDVGELLTLAVDKVIEATGAERGALMLAEGGGDEPGKAAGGAVGAGGSSEGILPRLTTIVARDRRKQNLKLVEKFSRTIPERVLATGESVCVIDTADDPERRGPFSSSVAELALRTVMCVPLATKDRTIGVIYVDSKTRSGDLKESNLPFFEGLARQVAFTIENARLRARLALGGMGE